MPREDGTGPQGKGPFTGRGAGYCIASAETWLNNQNFGYCGCGGGRGMRRMNRGRYPGMAARIADDSSWQQCLAEREVSWLSKRLEIIEQNLEKAKECLAGFNKTQE